MGIESIGKAKLNMKTHFIFNTDTRTKQSVHQDVYGHRKMDLFHCGTNIQFCIEIISNFFAILEVTAFQETEHKSIWLPNSINYVYCLISNWSSFKWDFKRNSEITIMHVHVHTLSWNKRVFWQNSGFFFYKLSSHCIKEIEHYTRGIFLYRLYIAMDINFTTTGRQQMSIWKFLTGNITLLIYFCEVCTILAV